MICPLCKENLDRAIFYGVEVDFCPVCLGMFFEDDELRLAKDEKDDELRWLDIDLWKKEDGFKLKKSKKICPKCRFPFYETIYGGEDIFPLSDQRVEVDICYHCHGIWLDRGEFKKIIEYLRARADYEIFKNWAKNLKEEFWEIFVGPETFREELLDFLMLLKVLTYKFSKRHSFLAFLISHSLKK